MPYGWNKRTSTYVLDRYPQGERTFYRTADGLPSDNVTHLAVAGNGDVWAATSAGLARYAGGRFEPVRDGGPPAAPASMLYADRQGGLWASVAGALYRFESGQWREDALFAAADAMAEDDAGTLFAASEGMLFSLRSGTGGWRKERGYGDVRVRAMAAFGERSVYMATDRGLYALLGKRPRWYDIPAGDTGMISNDTRCLFVDRFGHIWVGTDIGVCIHDDTDFFYRLDGSKGLPHEDVRAMAAGEDGVRWFGTPAGAIRLQDGKWNYFASKRWLPHDRVQAIALGTDGAVWFGTPEGLAKLTFRPMTLREKADHYDELIERHHKRFHYVNGGKLKEPCSLPSIVVEISDNDGLWTGDYVAAQSFKYAVTGDEAARERAKRSVHAMLDLLDVTGRPGFMARSIIHRSEPEFGVKGPRHEWRLSADGEWEWKGDASSDEAVGHFYAYAIYYDLAADERDKERIRSAVRAITDHIAENGFCLTDIDGLPTTWAVWAPEKLNHDSKWWEQRGINSLELLSFLKTAAHVTGDDKYERLYRDLVIRHHYALNTLDEKIAKHPASGSIDDNLAFHVYVPLLLYETDPDLRSIYLMSLERHWQLERPERSPLWNAVYGALAGRMCDIEAAVRSLAELPLDLVCYSIANSVRADLREGKELHLGLAESPLPADERPLHKPDKSPYRLDGGSDGWAEDGTMFLHPYWLARYFGLIAEPDL
ncbi:ligand-binding sensor domain-containing protein [Paenibacillus sp. GYB003]|uniref:ligand-binding sensor domain-containing protein n=1 Tax=Paenibacillus sp. GYB003 TaxID=2994392 RepID=UPI002F968E0D